jgi:hypothetical protein
MLEHPAIMSLLSTKSSGMVLDPGWTLGVLQYDWFDDQTLFGVRPTDPICTKSL